MISCSKHERLRLKFVATINDETLSEDTDPAFDLQYIDIGNVDSLGRINRMATYSFAEAPTRARRRVRDGDVILSCVRTYLQAIAAIQDPPRNLIVSTGFAVIRPLVEVMDRSLLKYVLRAPSFLNEVEMRSIGVSYPSVTTSALRDIPVYVPPRSSQRAIADYTDRETEQIDALVVEIEKLLELLAERRRALITRSVTRGLDPRAPLRYSGVPWLGEIPSHWKTRRLAWLFRERDARGKPDLPLLAVSINTGVSVRQFSDDRIETTAADFKTYKVARRGDVVFNKMRMWQGAVGIAPQDGLVSPDYVVAAPTGALLPSYASLLFRTGMFSAECARRSHGIVWDRLRLYWAGFRDIVVPLPSIDIQRAIVDHVAGATAMIDALVAAAENAIALLRERRATLIAAAVSGRIKVDGVA